MSAPGKILDASPPSDIAAEKAVLGSMILDMDVIDAVASILRPMHFFSPRHTHIYSAIMELHGRQVAVDFTTVPAELRKRKLLEEAGGAAYVTSLEQAVFSTTHAEHYARLVLEKYQLRELARVASEIQMDALTEREDVQQLLDQAEKMIFDLSDQRTSKDFQSTSDLIVKVLDDIEKRASRQHEVSGLATGYAMLDDWTGGFQRSDLMILAARPSMGKTALGLNFALNIGAGYRNRRINKELQRPVGIFSLEMSAEQVNQRMLSTLSGVSMMDMRKGALSSQARENLHRAATELHGAPIYVEDSPGISILELRAKCRRLAARQPDLCLIMVDYLQLMRGSGGKNENRQQEISEISRGLKALARELDIPILALSQLSRLVEQRKGKNSLPILSDLRESGAIEQDADIVMFIHREKTLDRKTDEDDDDSPRQVVRSEPAKLIIGKQRNGPIGIIDLVFMKDTATFVQMAKVSVDDISF
jgi:replicative DNA helicase